MRVKSLQKSLANWTGFPPARSVIEPRATRRAERKAIAALQAFEPTNPSPRDLAALHRRVAGVWRLEQSLVSVGLRDLRQLPWVLFYPPRDSKRWLGRERRLVLEYGRWLSEGRRTRAVLALLHEYLRVYPNTLPTFADLRHVLSRTVVGARPPLPPSLRKWTERCTKYRLLDPGGGEHFVGSLVWNVQQPEDRLREAGLDGQLAHSGFLRSGIRAKLPGWAERIAQHDAAENLKSLLDVLQVDGKLRFDDGISRAEIAKGLLSPYVDRKPKSEIREPLQSFFLTHFGDPRLGATKHRWASVPPNVTRVMLRWLVERVLEQFFVLLKETALDRHWRYREAFWKAFLDAGYIDDVWFVLGRRAAASLRRVEKDEDLAETTVELSGAQSDQSVLLLRMPGVTIAEWSHNGSCHLWLDGAEGAPSLYGSRYGARQVRRPFPYPYATDAHSQRHHGSETGKWQGEIVRWLAKNTGLQLSRDAYFPRHLREQHTPRSRWTYGR